MNNAKAIPNPATVTAPVCEYGDSAPPVEIDGDAPLAPVSVALEDVAVGPPIRVAPLVEFAELLPPPVAPALPVVAPPLALCNMSVQVHIVVR